MSPPPGPCTTLRFATRAIGIAPVNYRWMVITFDRPHVEWILAKLAMAKSLAVEQRFVGIQFYLPKGRLHCGPYIYRDQAEPAAYGWTELADDWNWPQRNYGVRLRNRYITITKNGARWHATTDYDASIIRSFVMEEKTLLQSYYRFLSQPAAGGPTPRERSIQL